MEEVSLRENRGRTSIERQVVVVSLCLFACFRGGVHFLWINSIFEMR